MCSAPGLSPHVPPRAPGCSGQRCVSPRVGVGRRQTGASYPAVRATAARGAARRHRSCSMSCAQLWRLGPAVPAAPCARECSLSAGSQSLLWWGVVPGPVLCGAGVQGWIRAASWAGGSTLLLLAQTPLYWYEHSRSWTSVK